MLAVPAPERLAAVLCGWIFKKLFRFSHPITPCVLHFLRSDGSGSPAAVPQKCPLYVFLFYYKEIYRRSGSRQNNNRADHNIQPQIGGFFLLLGFVVYFLILVFIV